MEIAIAIILFALFIGALAGFYVGSEEGPLFGFGAFLLISFQIAAVLLLGYVAIHFIVKFW